MLEAVYTNHTFENELKEINQKNRFFLTRKEKFQKKDSFMEKLTAFFNTKKYLISDQETNHTENKLFRKMIDLLEKLDSEKNQQNAQIDLLKKEIESKKREVLKLSEELNLRQQNIDSIKIEIHNLKQDVIVEKNEIELLKSKTLELEKANNESLEKNNKLEAEIVKINEELSTKNKEVEDTKIKLLEFELKVVEMQQAFSELNSKYAEAKEELKFKSNELEEMRKELKTQAEEIKNSENSLKPMLADQEKKNKQSDFSLRLFARLQEFYTKLEKQNGGFCKVYKEKFNPTDCLNNAIPENSWMIDDIMAFVTRAENNDENFYQCLEAVFKRIPVYVHGNNKYFDTFGVSNQSQVEFNKTRTSHCVVIGTVALLKRNNDDDFTINGKCISSHVSGINFEGEESSWVKEHADFVKEEGSGNKTKKVYKIKENSKELIRNEIDKIFMCSLAATEGYMKKHNIAKVAKYFPVIGCGAFCRFLMRNRRNL